MSNAGLPPAAEAERERGWAAVSRVLRYAVGMLEKGEQPPPMPEGLPDWPMVVLPAFVAGALHGGVSQYRALASDGLAPGASHSFNLQRAFRVLDSANRRGLSLGGLALLFFSVEVLTGVCRGHRSFLIDSAAGGFAVGGVFAAHQCIRTTTWPPPNLAVGVAIIVGIGLVQGGLQKLQYDEQQREVAAAVAAEDERIRTVRAEGRRHDPAHVLLAQLEAQLSGGQPQQAQQAQQAGQQQQPAGGGAPVAAASVLEGLSAEQLRWWRGQ